jgi:crotonobetainyl-CoA:carnitine CoA-transferase CaiB-like acyl-CoA transferase
LQQDLQFVIDPAQDDRQSAEQSEEVKMDVIRSLWSSVGGDPAALDHLRLTGEGPGLPSSFRVGDMARGAIAASGLAAAEVWRARGGTAQTVTVDMRHACAEARSERLLIVNGQPAPNLWDPIAGVYATADGFVRLHTNFAHHRQAVLDVLRCATDRAAVGTALLTWQAETFESEATARGCVVAAVRTPGQWAAHPHATALATLPLIEITRIGDAPPRPLPPAGSPDGGALAGLRVLDLTRVIAGPVAGRTLAAHGADVLLVTAPHLPSIEVLMMDTGRGKLATALDLRQPTEKAAFTRLLAGADILQQGYRPGGLAELGFGPEDAARMRPGIVYVSLSAYGRTGPWAGKHGFDSLVQCATGLNHAEAQAAGQAHPKELPCQILDHATGYLMALGGLMARLRQAREGGSWHVQVSLARTGQWLTELGRIDGLQAANPTRDDCADLCADHASCFGTLSAVRHAAQMSATPTLWRRPAMPLGTHPPVWPT